MKQSVYNQILLAMMALSLFVTMATAQTPAPAANNPDVMTELIGKPFTTYDRNDDNGCASTYGGAWWFGDDCARINLNGDFEESGRPGVWYGVPLDANKIVKMEMKIRPME